MSPYVGLLHTCFAIIQKGRRAHHKYDDSLKTLDRANDN